MSVANPPPLPDPDPGDGGDNRNNNIEADDAVDDGAALVLDIDTATPSDTDDDFNFDSESAATTSLASSIRNYEYSNGRRYHGYRSGAYVLPNDDEEQDRLDLLHHIFLLMLGGKLINAPLKASPHRVLDIGTGTGIWAIDFGDENPASQVVGTDLSPIQPGWVPSNVSFYIDDAESDWVYRAYEHFDLIHGRGLSGAINDWDRLCRQCFDNLLPGGWLEFQEPIAWFEADDDSMSRAVHTAQWQLLCNEAAAGFGKELRVGHTLRERMQRAGFIDIHERVVKVCNHAFSKIIPLAARHGAASAR